MKLISTINIPSLLTILLTIFVDFDITDCKPTVAANNRVQACGQHLADLLQEYCNKGYNTYAPGESAENTNDGRKRKGITQECCLQPCAPHDLLEYCHNGSSVAGESVYIQHAKDRDTDAEADINSNASANTDTDADHSNSENLGGNYTGTKRKSSSNDIASEYDYITKKSKPFHKIISDKLLLGRAANMTNLNRGNLTPDWNVGIKTTRYFRPPYAIDTKSQANFIEKWV